MWRFVHRDAVNPFDLERAIPTVGQRLPKGREGTDGQVRVDEGGQRLKRLPATFQVTNWRAVDQLAVAGLGRVYPASSAQSSASTFYARMAGR